MPPGKNHPRENERTICVRNTDCLSHQIRFICLSHGAKIDKYSFYPKDRANILCVGEKQIDYSFSRYVLGDMPVCCLKYLPKKD